MDAASRRLVPIFNYDLQVWIVDGHVRKCGHPERMRRDVYGKPLGPCCRAWKWQGLTEDEAIADYEHGRERA
jgi:hypothetical protein